MPSSRRLTSTRSDADFSTLNADEKSKLSTPDVNGGHFSTLNADKMSEFSTPRSQGSHRLTSTRSNADGKSDVDKKQRGDVATREVEEHNKYFSALYARVFSALAADEKLDTDYKSKFSTPDVDRSNGDKSPSSRRLTSTRSNAGEGWVFSELAADERLAHFYDAERRREAC
jgi:hypothetical protein